MENDLKRVLAYRRSRISASSSSASGSRSPSRRNGLDAAAALALTAALFHALNHAVQEPAVLRRRRGADRDRRARHGAGSAASSTACPRPGCSCWSAAWRSPALPPLNGFVSEWLMLQAILLQPAASAMGAEAAGAGRRRDARARRGAGRGLLRPRVRRRLPRPPAKRRGGGGARGRPLLARGDGRARRALPARRRLSRPS